MHYKFDKQKFKIFLLGVSLENVAPTSCIQTWHRPAKISNVCKYIKCKYIQCTFLLDELIGMKDHPNSNSEDNTDSFVNLAIANSIITHSTYRRNANMHGFMLDVKHLPLVTLNRINKLKHAN